MKFLNDKLKLRLYQEKIFNSCVKNDCLVILPTGLGKTIIALMLSVFCLKKKKILFLAPTKPLIEQHKKFFNSYFESKENELIVSNGSINPTKRAKLYKNANIIFSTPQTIENDLINERINFKDFSLIIYDECHKAIGNYSYTSINKILNKQNKTCKILGLSASPGSTTEKILEVCNNLNLKEIIYFNEKHSDVKPYIIEKEIKKIELILPNELIFIKKKLEICLKRKLIILKKKKIIESNDLNKIKKSTFLQLQRTLQHEIKNNKNKDLFENIIINSQIIKILHCLEILQTQGIKVLINYFNKLKKNLKIKSNKLLFFEKEFNDAVNLTYEIENKIEHPKFKKIKELIEKNFIPNSKFIIFAQLRETGRIILEYLKNDKFKPILFIGQRGKDGLNQKKQIKIIKDFENGRYNILIATSVAEEGLHIPNVKYAIFFEPTPSGLRMIQRKGRVGRTSIGKIIVLYTKDCIDEKYLYVSDARERNMEYAINNAKKILKANKQKNLKDYF